MLLNIVGFALIVSWTADRKLPQFHAQGGHRPIGLAVLIASLLQPVLGVLADRMFDPNRERTPFFPDILHWIVGYGIVLLSLFECYLGMAMCVFLDAMQALIT